MASGDNPFRLRLGGVPDQVLARAGLLHLIPEEALGGGEGIVHALHGHGAALRVEREVADPAFDCGDGEAVLPSAGARRAVVEAGEVADVEPHEREPRVAECGHEDPADADVPARGEQGLNLDVAGRGVLVEHARFAPGENVPGFGGAVRAHDRGAGEGPRDLAQVRARWELVREHDALRLVEAQTGQAAGARQDRQVRRVRFDDLGAKPVDLGGHSPDRRRRPTSSGRAPG